MIGLLHGRTCSPTGLTNAPRSRLGKTLIPTIRPKAGVRRRCCMA